MVGGHSASATVGGVGGRKLKFKIGNAIFSIIGRRHASHGLDTGRGVSSIIIIVSLFCRLVISACD